jgi:hypothetical protein
MKMINLSGPGIDRQVQSLQTSLSVHLIFLKIWKREMVVQSYLGFEYSNQIDMLYVDVFKGLHPHWSELQKRGGIGPSVCNLCLRMKKLLHIFLWTVQKHKTFGLK